MQNISLTPPNLPLVPLSFPSPNVPAPLLPSRIVSFLSVLHTEGISKQNRFPFRRN